jgi:hypothetical protein
MLVLAIEDHLARLVAALASVVNGSFDLSVVLVVEEWMGFQAVKLHLPFPVQTLFKHDIKLGAVNPKQLSGFGHSDGRRTCVAGIQKGKLSKRIPFKTQLAAMNCRRK